MSSVFAILNVGATGMMSASFGTNVAAHNSANVGTEGFSRRNATINSIAPPPKGGGGARAEGSRRVMDGFVERRMLGARSLSSGNQSKTSVLESLDATLSDVEGGLGSALDGFHRAIADVANYPGEGASRQVLLSRADQLARVFNRSAADLHQARSDANGRVSAEVDKANGLLSELASISTQIAKAEVAPAEASDLRDQRGVILSKLSDIIPITVLDEPNGQISVYLAGETSIVNPNGTYRPLQAAVNPDTGDVDLYRQGSGQLERIGDMGTKTGSIAGIINARDGALTAARTRLDTLATDVATAYNAAHSTGVGLDGASGRNLFVAPDALPGYASRMALSADVAGQPDFVAAAASGGSLPGDNENALAMQALATSLIASGGTSTSMQGLSSLIGSAGSAVSQARNEQEFSKDSLDQVTALRDQVSGVSVDEEMVNLQKFQRAYQASLQVIQVADQMLQSLMDLRR